MSGNEWHSHRQIIDEQQETVLMASTTAQEQQQQQQQLPALKCPRCDSSNTKFCYYNNYSLSQPRHFCKSCKRYWTRGGTLRNVPVGGGCRKNKRLRRPSGGSGIDSTTPPQSSSSSAVLAHANPSPSVLPQIELSPIFYGLPTSAPEFNFSGRFSDLNYELNHGVSGLGFSSDSSNPILASSSSSAATPTIASLLASTFQSQKLVNKTASSRPGSFQGLGAPFQQQDQIQASRENSNNVKVEEGKYWNNISGCQNPVEQQVGFSDPFMFWNMTNTSSTVGASQFLL